MSASTARGDSGDGEFGNVGVLRRETGDAAQAEPRAEPVDEMAELGGLVGRGVTGGKSRLHRVAALRDGSGEAHEIVAEAGIAGLAHRGEPVLEQAGHALRLAQRRAGSDGDPMHLAVGAEQSGFEQARALSPRLHRIAEPYA